MIVLQAKYVRNDARGFQYCLQYHADFIIIISGIRFRLTRFLAVEQQRIGEKMAEINNTQFFNFVTESELSVKKVLESVYDAMEEKGYNPVSQIVGYIMSGDPTYITSYNGARSMIMKVERDELVEELLREYIKNESWKEKQD